MATTHLSSTSTATGSGLSTSVGQLKFVSAGTVLFGLMIAFGAHQATDGPLRWFLDLLFWPAGDPQTLTNEAQVLAAILGGVMVGWAVMLWFLVDALAADQPQALRRIVLVVMAVWFVIDSTGSVAAGAWPNVIGNTGFLLMFVIPALGLTRSTVDA